MAAIATVLIGAGFGVAGFFFSAPEPTISPETADAVLAATAPRGTIDPQPDVVDDGDWSDADLRRCGTEAEAAAGIASERKLAAVSADRVGLGAPDPATVKRATFLLCSARTKPEHLCDGYWRNSLIEGIKAHAIDFRQVESSAYWLKVALAEQVKRDAERRDDVQVVYDDLDQTTRDVAKLHTEIGEALRALVADGIITRDDFGVFFGYGIPPEIRSMLGDAMQVRELCG